MERKISNAYDFIPCPVVFENRRNHKIFSFLPCESNHFSIVACDCEIYRNDCLCVGITARAGVSCVSVLSGSRGSYQGVKGVDMPNRRNTVHIVPILVGRINGLGFAVIIASGRGEFGIIRANANFVPIACHAGVVNGFQVGEHLIANACYVITYRNTCKIKASAKCKIPNARHTIPNRNARQVFTIKECIITNARHFVWNCDACKAEAVSKCRITDARYAIRYHNTL